jgi:peroxiredoxin
MAQRLSEGDMFPEIMFKTVDGELLKTEDLMGKVVFYNFYFAACPPCIAQKDGLNAVYERFNTNDDVVFISVTFDNYERINQFRNTHKIPFKIVSIDSQEVYRFVRCHPTNFLVGGDGKIVLKMEGGNSRSVRNRFSSAIQSELLKKTRNEKSALSALFAFKLL